MNTRRIEFWILLADLIWIVVAFLAADLLRFGLTWSSGERVAIRALLPFAVATCGCWTVLSLVMDMDGFRGGWRMSAMLSQLLLGLSCTIALVTTLGYFSRNYVSRLALTYFLFLLGTGFVGVRCGTRTSMRLLQRGKELWRVLILGNGRVAQEVSAKIQEHPEMMCKVVGLLFPNLATEELSGIACAGPPSQLSTLDIFDLIRQSRINEIIVALDHPLTPEIRALLARMRNMGIVISVVPQAYELYASEPKFVSLDGLPLLQLREPNLRPRYIALKWSMDFFIATVLLVPSILVIVPVATVLFLKKGSAFRRETRSGQYGVTFSMLRLDVERPVCTGSKFESFLEHLSITEIPQLWNVLRGQMSLVGPRPESPAQATNYSEWHQRRLRVKPGLTGLAQVHGLRESSSSEQKTRYDLQYAMRPYLLWDISLLLQTIWTLARRLFSTNLTRDLDIRSRQMSTFVAKDLAPNAHSAQPSAD